MDINDLRSLVTLGGFVLFVGLMAWTWRPAGRAANEAAAQLPFIEPLPHDETPADGAPAGPGHAGAQGASR
jgi:cytochrome c oxidase cbb3-type subunit IV